MEGKVTAAATDVKDTILSLPNATKAAVEAALLDPPGSLLASLGDALDAVEDVAPKMPPLVRNRLDALAKLLRSVLDAADLIDDIVRFVNGFDPSSLQTQFRYEWRPEIESWPSAAHPFLGIDEPILIFKPEGPGPRDNLVLAVDGRASGKGEMRVDVLAELRDFALLLLPGEPLVRFDFDHLSFKSGSTGKAEVDVVLNDIEFLGILGFIEVLKDLIPFDGFSDPPYLEVSPEGIVAGFSLALPSVAVGVFALSNMSLGADVSIPFLGKTVTVGFNFCTRERPFTLQVTFIGGGGWFLIRLSPDGLDVLELGLEAGATLSIDLGVASGSISAMIGVYMRLEGDGGSLAGYFRLRGEVDVLGIISASIELYLELKYVFDTGKMHRARPLDDRDRRLHLLRLGDDRVRAAVRRLEGRPDVRRTDGRCPRRHVRTVVRVLRRLRRGRSVIRWPPSPSSSPPSRTPSPRTPTSTSPSSSPPRSFLMPPVRSSAS